MIVTRIAGPADIPAVRRLAQIAFPATYRDIIAPAQVDYMMEWMYSEESLRGQMRAGHVFLLLMAAAPGGGPEPVGYASVGPEAGGVWHLHKLYLLPVAQGRGLGTALFRAAVDYARRHGARRVELNVNRRNPALGFYLRRGMHRAAEGDFDIGGGYFMNDYIMALDL